MHDVMVGVCQCMFCLDVVVVDLLFESETRWVC